MRGITKLIPKFDYNTVKDCIYGGAHDALIGEWINWWLNGAEENRKRRVINPAISATYKKKRYFADILFCERENKSEFYKVLGVAEVENNRKKYVSKLESLLAYEKALGVNNKKEFKFPHLEFLLLSTKFEIDEEGEWLKKDSKLIEEVEHNMLKCSKKSPEVFWIFYQMNYKRHKRGKFSDEDPDETFEIDYVKDADRFWYYTSFVDRPNYVIIRDGKRVKIDNLKSD